jgi:hypothetical protein
VAQFRVEFVLDQASGKYIAELYNPANHQELMVRTDPVYPTQAAAVVGLVQLFKDAVLKFPQPGKAKRKAKKTKKTRKAKKAKKAKRRKGK